MALQTLLLLSSCDHEMFWIPHETTTKMMCFRFQRLVYRQILRENWHFVKNIEHSIFAKRWTAKVPRKSPRTLTDQWNLWNSLYL